MLLKHKSCNTAPQSSGPQSGQFHLHPLLFVTTRAQRFLTSCWILLLSTFLPPLTHPAYIQPPQTWLSSNPPWPIPSVVLFFLQAHFQRVHLEVWVLSEKHCRIIMCLIPINTRRVTFVGRFSVVHNIKITDVSTYFLRTHRHTKHDWIFPIFF